MHSKNSTREFTPCGIHVSAGNTGFSPITASPNYQFSRFLGTFLSLDVPKNSTDEAAKMWYFKVLNIFVQTRLL
ncbi:MAG: hypothetical protein LC730_06105, partial [Acidobacteria bacterium]|nr:hypothetical protein [Acidobacteriota bacterium]